MIQPRYRQDYTGEFVVAETRLADGRKTQVREWIDNSVTNQHVSDRAAVIASDHDREQFDYSRLEKHRGGLLAKKRLQTYGCDALWNHMRFDFLVTHSSKHLQPMVDEAYTDSTVVFTTVKNCLDFPNNFYIVPYLPPIDAMAAALYLAAFDQHQEIFMLGYNNETPSGNRKWKEEVNSVIEAYASTQFILVGVQSNMPDLWRRNVNVRCMDYRKFISYCDV